MLNIDYLYVDENLINENYKCSICTKPFESPTTSPCDHTFCDNCIKNWLNQNSNKCPICHQYLTFDDFEPIQTRLVLNILDKFRVKCLHCKQDNIQKGNIVDHLRKHCPKAIVQCTASDIQCPWSGMRDQVNDHVSLCNYEKLRPTLSQLISINANLQEKVETLTTHLTSLTSLINMPTVRLLTFDKIFHIANKSDSGIMPDLYENFRWINVWFMHEKWVHTNHVNSGWKNAYTNNHECIIFNGKGNSMKICSKNKNVDRFSFISFEATAAWHDNLEISIIGRRFDQDVYSRTIFLQFDYSNIFEFNWKDIDQIEFIPIKGVQHSGTQYEEKYFALTWLLIG